MYENEVTPRLTKFVCGSCEKGVRGQLEPVEMLCDGVKMERGFCYLGDRTDVK